MKKVLREFFQKSVAAAAGAAILIQAQVPTFVRAAEAPQYISEVYLSYGNTPEEAKKWLTDNGYTVLDQDLNEEAQGGITADWLGWTQLHSEKRSVYLGYKTTTEKDEAITDMRAMNMKGGFSYEEYEKLLESKKTEINSFISDMKAALKEYRENYKNGVTKAKIAHDNLNTITDDDCGSKPLGDLLLKPIKEEMSEKDYNAAPEDHVDMVTLVMQGNTKAVNDIMTNLVLASDTADDSWLARLENNGGFDSLIEKYEKKYPKLSESKLNSLMVSEFDEEAKELSERIEELQESVKPYTESDIEKDADEAAVAAYFEEHTKWTEIQWSTALTKYLPLTEIKYEDGTLADIFTGGEYDFTSVDDRMALYPIIDAMSKGQRSLLKYIDLGDMVIAGNLGEEGWKDTYEKTKDDLKDAETSSVYMNVDRSVFDPAGVALTSEAREIQNTSGANYTNQLLGIDTSTWQYVGYGTTAVMLTAGISSLIYGRGSDWVTRTVHVNDAQQVYAKYEAQLTSLRVKAKTFDPILGTKIREELRSMHITEISRKGEYLSTLELSELTDSQLYAHVVEHLRDKNSSLNVHYYSGENYYAGDWNYIDPNKLVNDLSDKDPIFKAKFEDNIKNVREFDKTYNMAEAEVNETRVVQSFEPRTGWKVAGAVLCVAAALIAIGSAAVTFYDVYKYYHQDYAPIPRKIVHESTDKKGRFVYTVYDCVLCNRTAQGFMTEKLEDLGDYGDMNGDVGKEWLALYTTRDRAAGDPIRADLIVQKGSNKMPLDKNTGIRMFGKTDTVNIVSEEYGYNDAFDGLYIFASAESEDNTPKAAETKPAETKPAETKPAETAPAETKAAEGSVTPAEGATKQQPESTGTVVGSGSLVLTGVLSAAAGAVICFLLTRKKREG